jgi:hypothetical protein
LEPKSKCTQYSLPTDYFFPVPKNGRPSKENVGRNQLHMLQAERAKFCNGTNDGIVCGYKQQCLEMGMYNYEPGVWGGTTEAEREVILAKQKRKRYSAQI